MEPMTDQARALHKISTAIVATPADYGMFLSLWGVYFVKQARNGGEVAAIAISVVALLADEIERTAIATGIPQETWPERPAFLKGA